jgi:hypothetical protein
VRALAFFLPCEVQKDVKFFECPKVLHAKVSSIDQRTFGAKKQVLLSNTKKQKKLWSVFGKGNASSPQVLSNTKKPEKKKAMECFWENIMLLPSH